MDQALLSKPADINKLAHTLISLTRVSRFDTDEEIEGGSLAHAFSDLESAFRKFLLELLPRLTAENVSDAEATNILHEIGEEFRHINYHLHDPKFYEYLWQKGA